MSLPRLHLIVGLAALIMFPATGLYMLLTLPSPEEGDLAVRFLHRANHIYILASGLLNLALMRITKLEPPTGKRARVIGSWLALIAPVFLIPAFFIEPPKAQIARPVTEIGMVLLTFGVLMALWKSRKQRSKPQ